MVTESWGLLSFVMQLLISIPHITDCLEKVPAKLIMFPTSISIIIIPWWGNIVAFNSQCLHHICCQRKKSKNCL